jgi:hypothetical protein
MTEIQKLRRDYERAKSESWKWAQKAAAASSEGVTRKRMTTINANWSQAAERREELEKMLKSAEAPEREGQP